LNHKDYRDELAPFPSEDDFSTSSILKNKGDKLTTEKLADLSLQEQIFHIMLKCHQIQFERLYKILSQVANFSKKILPSPAEIANVTLDFCYFINERLVLKSRYRY